MIANYGHLKLVFVKTVETLLLLPLKCLSLLLYGVHPSPSDRVQTILVQNGYLLGDALLLGPALQHLRRLFPGCRIHLLTSPAVCRFLEGTSWVDQCLPLRPPWFFRDGSFRELLRCLRNLRARRYDLAIDFHGDPRNLLLLFFTGADRREAACDLGFGFLCTRAIVTPPAQHHQFERSFFLLTTLYHDKETHAGRPVWPYPCSTNLHIRTNADGRVLLHPGTSRALKRWPNASFSHLANLLYANGFAVACVGAPKDRDRMQTIAAGCSHGFPLLCPHLRELGTLVSRAQALVCLDSFVQHVAWAFELPCVVLYGPTNMNYTLPAYSGLRAIYADTIHTAETAAWKRPVPVHRNRPETVLQAVLQVCHPEKKI